MRFSKTTFSFLMLFFSLASFAQDFPKTIGELYQVPLGSCDFVDASGKFADEAVATEMVVESAAFGTGAGMAEKSPEQPAVAFKSLISVFQNARSGSADFSPQDKVLKNGNVCFFENGKWGLKDPSGKVIVKAKFDYVFPDTVNGGFSGFTGTTCNYYDGANGKKQLEGDYFWISSADKNVFIVRSGKGYGLLKDGKTLIEPGKKHIRKASDGYETYYQIQDAKTGTSVLRNDLKTQLPFSAYYSPLFAGSDFVFSNNNIFNLKTGKKLVCGSGFYFKLVSRERQLAAVKKAEDQFFYLIDFAGNIITATPFGNVEMIKNDEGGIASIFDKNSASRHPPQKFGLINAKGEWIVQPEHKSIYPSRQREYLFVKTAENLVGLIDFKGNPVIPAEYSEIKEIGNGRYLCAMVTKGSTESRIINAETGAVEKDGLDFQSLSFFDFCDPKGYLAGRPGSEQVLDENFQPVTGTHSRIFTEGEYLVGADFNLQGRSTQKKLYDCSGKVLPLQVNGESVEVFQEVKAIGKNLFYVYFSEGDKGYFVTKDGKTSPATGDYGSFSSARLGGLYLAYSKNYEQAGMIDSEGRTIVPLQLNYLTGFDETGMACFRLRKDVAGIVDSKGALLHDKMFQQTSYLGLGLYKVKAEGKVGVMDASGKFVIAPEYPDISMEDGLIRVFTGSGASILYDIAGQPVE